MTAKSRAIGSDFRKVDAHAPGREEYEVLPVLTGEELTHGAFRIGGRIVSKERGRKAFRTALRRGRPRLAVPKQPVTLRVDAEVAAKLRASGRGWQTRVNRLLAEAVREGRV